MYVRSRSISLLFPFLFSVAVCGPGCGPETPAAPTAPLWRSRELSIKINEKSRIPVSVYTPTVPLKGEVLVLPGWKHARTRWLSETKILAYARGHGFRLILPEMGVTTYESRYFPETEGKWAPVPGLVFVTDYLIPALQKEGFLVDPATGTTGIPRLLMGLSTGGRGVLQIGLARPRMFQAAAAFSGDYDQTRQPNDRLMTLAYGPYEDFKERWERVDNPIYEIDAWTIPIYLAHGTKDRVVPVGETRHLYQTLQTVHPRLTVEIETPAMGHDYPFWDDATRRAFLFFERVLKTQAPSTK